MASVSATKLPGVLFAGRYTYRSELGSGASARVILAEDRELGVSRALKVVPPELAARLAWELGILARIDHPNVAAVVEMLRAGEASPEPFRIAKGSAVLVEHYAPGQPADEIAAALEGEARVDWTLRIGEAIARGLAAIHAHGVVHGDVKPENVLCLEDASEARLVDLGLARAPGRAAFVSGTPGYLAPEAWQGELSFATDLYALGVCLSVLLEGGAGRPEGASVSIADRIRHAFEAPLRVAAIPLALPEGLDRLLEALLDPDPRARPGAAREVAARLAELGGRGRGGRIDEAPTPQERSAALHLLPLIGRGTSLEALVEALMSEPLVAITGPAGVGRTRLIDDAVREVQRRRFEAGGAVPTHRRLTALPELPPPHAAILSILDGDSVALPSLRSLLEASRLGGAELRIVLRRHEPLEGAPEIALTPLEDEPLGALLGGALGRAAADPGRAPRPITPSLLAAAREISGGLPGRLCRLLAEGVAEELPLERPATLRQLGASCGAALVLRPDARALSERLAVAGGALDLVALDGAIEGFEHLVGDGLATLGAEGRLVLRADLRAPILEAMSPAHRAARARELLVRLRDPLARAHALTHLERFGEAAPGFLEIVEQERRGGVPEEAARVAEFALGALASAPAPSRSAALEAIEAIEGALRLHLADALRALGRYEEALERLVGEPGAEALLARLELERLLGRPPPGASLAPLLDGAPAGPLRVRARALRARLALDAGQLEEAEREAERALAEAEALEDPLERPRALEILALARLYGGDPRQARQAAERGLELSLGRQEPGMQARLRSVLGTIATLGGELERAAAQHRHAFEAAERAGERHASASFLVNAALAQLDAGELGSALEGLREGARRLARLGLTRPLGRALYNLGNAALLTGDLETARFAAERARDAATRTHDGSTLACAQLLDAEIALRAGALEQSCAGMRAAWAGAGSAPAAVRACIGARLVLALARAHEGGSAAALLEEIASLGEAGGSLARVEIEVARARVELEAGRGGAALEAARRAMLEASGGGNFEARLRSAQGLADIAERLGSPDDVRAGHGAARALLDRAAATLRGPERLRLRSVPAYQRALVTLPPRIEAAQPPERWRHLATSARALMLERRSGRLYEKLLGLAFELVGAERGFLVLRDRQGGFRVRAALGIDRSLPSPGAQPSRSIVSRVLDTGRAIRSVDVLEDESLSSAASVLSLSLRSVLAVPLRRGMERIGVLYLDDGLRPAAFSEEDGALVETLVGLGGGALEAAELLRRERRQGRRIEAERRALEREVDTQKIRIASLTQEAPERHGGMIVGSPAMKRLIALARRVAATEIPVLISGESGTGKELIARFVHAESDRRAEPFIIENCGAIPESLLESTLFGHVRGAFTGAGRSRAGLFEAADGGTLFLDEIGEMSPALQAKLLRAVQYGEIRPVGADRMRRVNVRIIAATHRDLPAMVREGTFREDLYFRLAVLPLSLPPLRERAEEIPALVEHLLALHAPDRQIRVRARALELLSEHAWPGNIRELDNELCRALVLADDEIEPAHLSEAVRGDAPEAPATLDLKGSIARLERRLILEALARTAGNRSRAARELGVSRYGLLKMIRRLGLE